MILKKLPKNAIVPKFHGKCDGWVPTNELIIEDDNNKIYHYDNAQRYAEQMEGEDGLKNCNINLEKLKNNIIRSNKNIVCKN